MDDPDDFDYNPEPIDSGVKKLTARDLRKILEARAAVTKGLAAAQRVKKLIWGAVGGTVTVVVIAASVRAYAQTMVDAGSASAIQPIAIQTAQNTAEIAQVKGKVETIERSTIRSEAMLEMVLNNRGMRPPPKLSPDGGTL